MKTSEKIKLLHSYDELAVIVRRLDGKGGFVDSDRLGSPLQLINRGQTYSPEQQKDILEMLYKTKKSPDSERVEFKSEEEMNNYIAKIQSQIDPYTIYIDSYKQQKEAEEHNDVLRAMISFVEEYGFMPERIGTHDFKDYYINQAFAIIDGVEKRNERQIVLCAIDWMKRMGFQKTRSFPNAVEENVVRYAKSVDSRDLKFDYEMLFEISKDSQGKYHVKFYYDFYDFRGRHCTNEASLYTPVFMRKGANMIDSKSRSYSYR